MASTRSGGLIPLTVAEAGPLGTRLARPAGHYEHWSQWRRRHQATTPASPLQTEDVVLGRSSHFQPPGASRRGSPDTSAARGEGASQDRV